MKMVKRYVLFVVVLATGCVLPPPNPYSINVELKVNAGSAGQDRELALEVTDKRGSGGSNINFTVPVEGDFAAIVRDSISQGLQSEGFAIVDAKQANGRELRVDIVTLRQMFHAGLIIPYHQVGANVVLKSSCVATNVVRLEKYYSKSHWTCCFHSETREEKEQLINRTVSNAINEMLNDDELRQCLIEPKPVPGAAEANSLPRRSEDAPPANGH